MAVDLNAIHRALAAKILAGLARDTNVQSFPIPPDIFPSITVYPGSPYLDFFTSFGPAGTADMKLRVKIEVEGDAESMAIKICAYLGIGDTNTSSIPDAINTPPRTLGGLVADCVALSAEWDAANEPGTAWVDVLVYLSKTNAKV